MLLIERFFAAVTIGLCNLLEVTQEDVERVKARELGRRGVPFHPGRQDWQVPSDPPSGRRGDFGRQRQVVVRFGR